MALQHLARILLALALITAIAPAQGTTHLVWMLDAGTQSSPSPVLHAYAPDGAEVLSIPVPGSSQARGMAFGDDGGIFVARGNQVRVLDRGGSDTGIVLVAPSGSSKAQDVLARGPDQVWVSWGVASGDARLCRYDVTAAPPGNLAATEVFGPGLMDHPRRIVGDPGAAPSSIFIANRGTSELLVFDVATQTFSVASDLAGNTLGPVGLAFDATRSSVWVSGDWGQTTEIGLVSTASFPSPFTTVLNYGGGVIPGLEAPADLHFDRFRRLYVASRSSNGGTPSSYIFAADAGNLLTPLVTFPISGPTLTNVIDVDQQPVEATICGPTDENGDMIIQTGVLRPYTISAPDFAGSFFVAALSSPWATFTPGYVPGILSPSLTLQNPDPRGLPWTCDFVFQLTTGVATLGGPSLFGSSPGNVPCPSSGLSNANQIDLDIAGFVGVLDASGQATLLMQHLGIFPGADGMDLGLSFVTIDFTVSNGIGLIANPVAVKIRSAPASVTICP